MKFRWVKVQIFILTIILNQAVTSSCLAHRTESKNSEQAKKIESLLTTRTIEIFAESNKPENPEAFLKSGRYGYNLEGADSLEFSVEVSDSSNPTIVLTPAPCAGTTTDVVGKDGFLFECKNITDECAGYPISSPESQSTFKRLSSNSFLIGLNKKIYVFKNYTHLILTSKWTGFDANPQGAQAVCDRLKIKATVDSKDRCGKCGGDSSKMTFEFEQRPWVEHNPYYYPYNCEVTSRGTCPY